ncbi:MULTISPECIES: hypothetical protein [Edaphocola]|uniref:hypothetical protein n=1 Tax=Edaphocola TaxID=2601681 RepID=UPI000F9545E9|nr:MULTISPECIES: hypothetical protein [Edaphocola]
MKKKILFLLCTGMLAGYTMKAQTNTGAVNPKITAVYGTHVNTLMSQDPQRLTLLNQLLTDRIQIMELDQATAMDKFPALSNQPVFNKYVPGLTVDAVYNPATFNPLKYNLSFFNYGDVGYWIDGTNKVLMIRGMKNFINP